MAVYYFQLFEEVSPIQRHIRFRYAPVPRGFTKTEMSPLDIIDICKLRADRQKFHDIHEASVRDVLQKVRKAFIFPLPKIVLGDSKNTLDASELIFAALVLGLKKIPVFVKDERKKK